MKVGIFLIFLYIFQIGLILFYGLINNDTTSLSLGVIYTNGTATPTASNSTSADTLSTWEFMSNPGQWQSSGLMQQLIAILGISGAIGIGLYLLFKSDLVLLFGFFSWMLMLGSIPIINLWGMVTSEVGVFACDPVGSTCIVSLIAGFLTAGFLGLLYLFSCIEWWSMRQAA